MRFACRQSAMSSLRASCDDHRLARASTAIGGARQVPSARSASETAEAPGELDHAAADPSVACSGEPLFAPLSSGEPVRPV